MARAKINFGFDRFSAIYLWIVFLVVFGIWSPHLFLTSSTVHFVASQQAVSGILALAILIPLTCGQFDLSIGATANLAGIVAALLQNKQHWPLVPAILFSIGVGVVVGLVNGFIVVKLSVNSFIATLGMSSILAALLVIVTGSLQPSPPVSTAWTKLSQFKIGGYQIVVLYLIILALIIWWMLDYTPVGRYMYSIGGNPEASRLSGVRVDRWVWLSLVLSGGVSALGGVLYTSLTGPSLSFGGTLLLPAFAAAFLGSTQLQRGRFNVWGTLIAIYVLATGVEGLQLVSGAQWLGDMFNGVALIIAVALAVDRTRVKKAPKQEQTGAGLAAEATVYQPEATGEGTTALSQSS